MPSLIEQAQGLQRLAIEVENAFTEMNRAGHNDTISVLSAGDGDRFEIVANTSGARQRLRDTMAARDREHADNSAQKREVLAGIELDRTPEELAEIISASAPNAALNLERGLTNGANPTALAATLRRLRQDAAALQQALVPDRNNRHSREDMYTMLDEILRDDSVVGDAKVSLLQQAIAAARTGVSLREADNPLLYLTQQLLINLMGAHR